MYGDQPVDGITLLELGTLFGSTSLNKIKTDSNQLVAFDKPKDDSLKQHS